VGTLVQREIIRLVAFQIMRKVILFSCFFFSVINNNNHTFEDDLTIPLNYIIPEGKHKFVTIYIVFRLSYSFENHYKSFYVDCLS